MIEGLNNEQSLAAKAVYGPVMVFAGAGSGKTRTLTYRIINMIMNEKISPYNILAITFTNKATNEMRERLMQYLDVDVKSITISTFHSLCARILRRDIGALGYSTSFTIIDEEDQLKLIGDILKEQGREKKEAKHVQKVINYCKCFGYKPEDPGVEVVYIDYEKKMKAMDLLDFEDLLIKVYELFTTHEEILFKYQERFKYILVDEFQDTNLIQYKIIKLIALKYQNIFVVGDDDQSIYSFRGTNYENMNLFKKDFPLYQKFTLTENYRSTQTILDYSNRLISKNVNREKKELFTNKKGNGNEVVLCQARDERDEVEFVIDKIMSLKSANNSYKDFAILYRSSMLLRNFELGLIRHQIPYKVYGGLSYLRRREIKDIIAYFKLLINDNDFLSFKRIINVPTRGIGLTTIEKFEEFKKQNNYDVFKAIDECHKCLPKAKSVVLKGFKDLIFKYRDKLDNTDLLTIFDELVNEIEYFDYLKDEADSEDDYKDRFANLAEFKSILWSVENSGDIVLSRTERLREAFDSAILSDEYLQNQKESPNGVTVSTIHSVKGLEYRYVFIVGFEENIFPNNYRVESSSELEEERRIAYVAMTRAKEMLFLSCAESRLMYGSFLRNEPSRFLIEATGASDLHKDSYEEAEVVEERKQLTDSKEKKDDSDFKVSDKVIHKAFGEGIILEINNGIGSIFFDQDKKMRKILLNHPAITKK